jgi:hypothetical protein
VILKVAGAMIMICVIAAVLYAVSAKHGSAPVAARPTPPPDLTITVTGAESLVFVRRPGGEVLVNQTLTSGQSVHFTGPPFDVVLGDAKAVTVYVRGRPRAVGPTAFSVS